MATLNISFTIPDGVAVAAKDDFAAYHGWQSTIPDPSDPLLTIPNPETQNAFIKRKVGEFIKDSIRAQRAVASAEAARQASITNTDSNITLT